MMFFRAPTMTGVEIWGRVTDWRMREELNRAATQTATARFPPLFEVWFANSMGEL
jgi:hypothetical protein